MTIAQDLVTQLTFTIRDSTRELLDKANQLPNIAKNLYAKKQIAELQRLHTAVSKNPEDVNPEEVVMASSDLLDSMRGNLLFKVGGLNQKLQKIFLADTNLTQKVKDVFALADGILEQLQRSGEAQQKMLKMA